MAAILVIVALVALIWGAVALVRGGLLAASLMGGGVDWLQSQVRTCAESESKEEKKRASGPAASWAAGIALAAAMIVSPLATFYNLNDWVAQVSK